MRNPQIIRELQQFVEERTPYFLHVGLNEFQRTGESSVERIVFKRESLAKSRSADADEQRIGAIKNP